MVVQVNPSWADLEHLLKIQQQLKHRLGPGGEDLLKSLGFSGKIILRILQLRTAHMSRKLSQLERERLRCLRNFDFEDLRNPANFRRMRLLERLVNEYFLLTEGMIIDKQASKNNCAAKNLFSEK